jgi:chemotaxis protein MotB
MSNADHHVEEIIIVRRHGGDHDDHHGGVWKIAFADFMTALMCFFLVMWLINAANEETKVSVASYFNPIKLTDRNASRRGLDEAGAGPETQQGSSETPDKESTANDAKGPATAGEGQEMSSKAGEKAELQSDENLFSDPYAVLAEIAAESGELQNLSEKGDGGAGQSGAATGASGGESFRDPFAPDFWSKQVEQDQPGEPDLFEQPKVPNPAEGADPRSGLVAVAPEDDPFAQDVFTDPDKVAKRSAAADDGEADAGEGRKPGGKAEAGETGGENVAQGEPGIDPAAARLAQEIQAELSEAFGTGEKITDGITVTPTDRGVMISLTDQLDYGMFEIGSAVPRRDLVLAMEKVASILNGKPGAIIINGHTDARPFRNDKYDNWRLSSARAQSAYYMLVRGGLAEMRVREITGYADRQLKLPDEPYSDTNRRIEILLETGG